MYILYYRINKIIEEEALRSLGELTLLKILEFDLRYYSEFNLRY